jgi:phage terminase large subunit-like protein
MWAGARTSWASSLARRNVPTSLIRTKSDAAAIKDGCYFDPDAGERVGTFFSKFLRHSKGQWAGKAFELQPWQRDQVIRPLFGWKRPDGTRRYRRAYIEIPKKNGKSTLSAGISLYLLVADNEPGAEVYNAACDREQASIVFREAANMVRASAELSTRLDVVDSTKRIVFHAQAAVLKALSADVPTKEGLNWHGLIFDELHAQKTRHLWDTLYYGGASRRQPLLVSITTAGFDRDSICWEQHEYAQGLLDGTIGEDWSFFPFIAAAAEADDWKVEATWRKANPSYGVTIKPDEMAEAARDAQASPAKENSFKRYRLDQWTEQETRWHPVERWDACDQPSPLLDGRECFAAIDLASTTDLAALVLGFPDGSWPEPDALDLLLFCWATEHHCRERERLNRPRLDAWIRSGLIDEVPGFVVDYDRIREKLKSLREVYNVRKVALDRWNAAQLATQLEAEGFEVCFMGQGFASMSGPTKEYEKLLLGGKLRHGGNQVLRWMFRNLAVEMDAAGNLKPSKKHAREKIDGQVAAIMTVGLAMVEPLGVPSITFM